jgi:hypothetical protein
MRHWSNAASVADLGNLMADWLEGRIPKRPGYFGRRPDPETTTRLIRTLAAINRAGYVTEGSQPGCDEMSTGRAKRTHWLQCAAVQGFITDLGLLGTIRDAARRASLTVIVDGPQTVVTWVDGKPYTAFGGTVRGGDLRIMWDGIGRDAWADIRTARQVAIIDPHQGPSDRLWDLLDQIARRYG